MIRLVSSSMEVELDHDHGAEILSVRHPGGDNVLATYDWASPVWASRSTSYGDEVSDWLSEYRGGWQELFPNAGDACTVLGVPLPFHGEVSRTRWQVVERGADRVSLTTPTRLPLVLERRMRLAPGGPVLLIEETARTEADIEVPFLWGHHPAFAAAEGARIDLPADVRVRVDARYVPDLSDLEPRGAGAWPLAPERGGGSLVDLARIGHGPVQRLAYLSSFGDQGWVAIRGVSPGLGVAMAWDAATFPHAWFWWEVGGPGHPWHGRARIVAVEPATACPSDGLAAAVQRGEAHMLRPGESRQTWLTMSLFDADERPVTGVGRDGSVER